MATNESSCKDVTQEHVPRKPWVKKAVVAGLVLLVLGLSGMAGYFIWRATKPSSAAPAVNADQLPPPGSAAAKALLADSTTSDSIRSLYQAAEDAATITPKDTEAFLERLQAQLSTVGYDMDLTLFVDLANQVVLLLQQARADALLSLLRQYAQTGSLALESNDQDQLLREVNSVLQPSAWDTWFRFTSTRDSSSVPIRRDWDTAFPDKRIAAIAEEVVKTAEAAASAPAAPAAAPTGAGRRLLRHQAVDPSSHQNATARHRRLAAAAQIPVITGGADDAGAGPLPTQLPPQTLEDMLCAIAPFAGKAVDTSKCKPQPKGMYSHAGLSFKPVTVPVVFHCMRFLDSSGVIQPPFWQPIKDAEHLIAATNAKYQGTGITFSLKEMRVDPKRYPYLMLGSMEWYNCAPGDPAPESIPCITRIMQAHADTTYAINVIVTGAAMAPALCSTPEAKRACDTAYLGFANTLAPWMPAYFASPSWTEDNIGLNWVHITYEYISPAHLNSPDRDDGGAATLAHEFGHYLGLRHTHEGECEGDGVALADAVPDTPRNKDVQQFAGEIGLSRALGRFCSNWRKGKPTDVSVLRRFNSCNRPGVDVVDNVFNIMSYMPDSCFFMFTENQVARLQWAMVTYRPKLMARYAA